jgi:hypothetical protein
MKKNAVAFLAFLNQKHRFMRRKASRLDARTQTAAMKASRRSLSAREAQTILELGRISAGVMLQPRASLPPAETKGCLRRKVPCGKQPPKCDNSPHVFDRLPVSLPTASCVGVQDKIYEPRISTKERNETGTQTPLTLGPPAVEQHAIRERENLLMIS